MVERYTPEERPSPPPAPAPEPGWDDDDTSESRRGSIGIFSVGIVVIAVIVGLVVFGMLTGIGERLRGPDTVAITPGPTASGTVGIAAVKTTEGTATVRPASTRPAAPAVAADLPAPPNAELVSLATEQQSPGINRSTARYQSFNQPGSIQEYYDAELPKRGWSKASGPTAGITAWTKPDSGIVRGATVELAANGNGTMVAIQVTLPRDAK